MLKIVRGSVFAKPVTQCNLLLFVNGPFSLDPHFFSVLNSLASRFDVYKGLIVRQSLFQRNSIEEVLNSFRYWMFIPQRGSCA